MKERPSKKRRKEKKNTFNIGDLVKIRDQVPFLEPETCGKVGLIISFRETGYPKGLSGRSNDGTMYTVAALGKNVQLFEDEMEMLC